MLSTVFLLSICFLIPFVAADLKPVPKGPYTYFSTDQCLAANDGTYLHCDNTDPKLCPSTMDCKIVTLSPNPLTLACQCN
jgi:hypothetical protein